MLREIGVRFVKIFIIGVNGFIGSALARRVLNTTTWNIVGIDVEKDRLEEEIAKHDRFEFLHGDMSINEEWVEFQIKRCDVVLPLAAIAVPRIYVEDPLRVFELDFLENLRIIQHAVNHGTRLIFPSSSEVYGKAPEEVFDEESTDLVVGPTNKQRWIYSCSKELLDRVIHAYGLQESLNYTIFRPFNWIGPGLDRINEEKIGNSRVVTQFISDIVFNRPLTLVDGGWQKRCFLYLEDGIDALMCILDNPDRTNQQIFNIGNPENELSIRKLAFELLRLYGAHSESDRHPFTAGVERPRGEEHFGEGFQDITRRMPSIHRARDILGWEPIYGVTEALSKTLDWFLAHVCKEDPQ